MPSGYPRFTDTVLSASAITRVVPVNTSRMLTERFENRADPDKMIFDEVPEKLYRAGKPAPSNLRPRAIDQGKLSFRDTLSNPWPLDSGQRPVFVPGDAFFAVDPARLPPGSIVSDNDPPGHVLVTDVTPEEIQNAVVDRGKFPK